jgi:hypothetical protein
MGILKRFSTDAETKRINKRLDLEGEIIFRLSKYENRDPEVLYACLRKYMAARYPYLDDRGYIGVADDTHPGLYYTGDILIHTTRFELKPGDIVHFRQYGPDEMYVLHGKINAIDDHGYAKVEGPTGLEGLINLEVVMGVLIEVIPFREGTWERLFVGLMGSDYERLKTILSDAIAGYSSEEVVPEKQKNEILSELERRLDALRG